MITITIKVTSPDQLHEEQWRFVIAGTGFAHDSIPVHLNRASVWTRKTRRHGWTLDKNYDALDKRNSTIEKPDVPASVVAQLKKEMIDRLDLSAL